MIGLISIYLIGLYNDAGSFLSLGTVSDILFLAAPTALMGYGVALLMVTAEFDLSVGSLFGLAAALVATMATEIGINKPIAIVIVLVFAALYGITQGLLVTKLNLPSLIVTIGTLTMLRGIVQIMVGGTVRTIQPENAGVFRWFGGPFELGYLPGLASDFVLRYQVPFVHESTRTWSSFDIMIIWAVVFLLVFHYILFYTRFGHHVRATGDNVQSVGTTGVDPEIIKIGCFAIVAMMAAFAGIAYFGSTTTVETATGDGRALFVIAAVVLGGTELTGGEGSMTGVVLGSLVLATANQVLFSYNLGVSGWQGVVTGAFIVAAIGLDVVFRGFSTSLIRQWYTVPTRELLSSPTSFFRVKAIRKTTDDMFGYLMLSAGLTAILTNVLAWVIGQETVASNLGLTPLSPFKLILEGNWPETVAQVYLFLLLLAVSAFVVVEIVTGLFDRDGDYESTLAIACYGSLFAPLFAVPVVMYGFDIFFVQGELISSLIVAVPVVLGMLGVMYAGVRELHGLSREKALGAIGAVVAVWLVGSGVLWWALTNVQPPG